MNQHVMIASQFNGPPGSANGGYVSGLIADGLYAQGIAGGVEVSLHAPPPLDTDLNLESDHNSARLMRGESVLGVAKTKALDLDLPQFPIKPELIGTPQNPDGRFQPFDECFVCGTSRVAGDGLCLHGESIKDAPGMVATRWDIHPAFTDGDFVAKRFVWSALDCPGYFACAYGEAALLARLNAEIYQPVPADVRPWVFGWEISEQSTSRKRRCGTAVVDEGGTVYAAAEGLWIIVDISKMPTKAGMAA